MKKSSPTFKYWITCREYLLLNCRFIRGQRSGDWLLTLDSLKLTIPWLFVFNRTNYARWLPVYIRDMLLLERRHPLVHRAFCKGLFVIQRGRHKFSLMAMDQNQEHNIKFMKQDGGCKGLYGQQDEHDMIEISRPGLLSAIKEFEDQLDGNPES